MYYAQHACFAATGAFAPTYAGLRNYSAPPFELCPLDSSMPTEAGVSMKVTGGGSGFVATVQSPDGAPWQATVTNDRFLTVAAVGSGKIIDLNNTRVFK